MSMARAKLSYARPRRSRARRALRAFVWTAAAGFALLLVWCGWLYAQIATFHGISSSDKTVRADAGIVLGASLWNDKPSPGLSERLDHALALYREGVFPRIIVTGGLDAGGATITEAEGMRNYLTERGVPEDAIFMDTESRSTYENLIFAQDIMKAEGWKSAVVVTHRYHGARAADIARTLGYDPVQVSVTETKVMNVGYHQAREVLAFTKWKWNKLLLTFG
ncbi:YdcF family protein [Cohnella sp. CFH 77786]|uniref:YdcF family protein n=1 Tax=Cohnella sp. CFH 77786 TaxID=2662265 RepID=UPI001C60A22F|nr:YdcF family protein [Cohnella sp. CFH 77786]MBW5448192.1 YdcF family protein [Cohnella sp. CFH 77786]